MRRAAAASNECTRRYRNENNKKTMLHGVPMYGAARRPGKAQKGYSLLYSGVVQFRRTRRADLSACVDVIDSLAHYRDDERVDVVRMWAELLDAGIAYSAVVTDDRYSFPAAFGISAFVDDVTADGYHRYDQLDIGYELFARWRAGRSLFLSEAALARANAGDGANCVVIAAGWKPVDEEPRRLSSMRLIEGFMDVHLGLKFRSFIHELYGKLAFPAEGLGVHVIDVPPGGGIDAPVHTFLAYGARVEGDPENFIRDQLLTVPVRPRWRLDGRCRAVLRLALDGLSDAEIANEVGISRDGLKKRWSRIFQAVREADPNLLGARGEPAADGKRGTEIRNLVLTHVRNHREELHPYAATAASAPRHGAVSI